MSTIGDDLASKEEMQPRRAKSLWLNLDYMLLWSGQMVSNVGTQVSTLASAHRATRSPLPARGWWAPFGTAFWGGTSK